MDSKKRVLIAYASKYGSTRGVAERIATRLSEHGSLPEILEADETIDVGSYDAVVLGSPVYYGSWLPKAVELVRSNATELARRPVWLFSLGAFGDRHPVLGPLIRREPREISSFRRAIHPRGYRVFAGVMEPERWILFVRWIYRGLGGRWGDNRGWADIDAWAEDIARELLAPARI